MELINKQKDQREKKYKAKRTEKPVKEGGRVSNYGVDFGSQKFFENRIEREWLSSKEAANYLRLSENALRIMVHRGQVPALRLGRRLRFRLEDCLGLISKEGA